MASIGTFSGLASGIQWRDMIERIMELEAARRVKPLTSRASLQDSRINAWNSFQGLVSKLRGAAQSLSTNGGLAMKATVGATSTGRSVLTATASDKAVVGTYKVEVQSSAKAEKLAGISVSDPTTALGLSGTFFINGRDVVIGATDSLNAVRQKINAVNSGANASGVTATVLSTGSTSHSLVLNSDYTGSRGIELVDSTSNVLQGLGLLTGTSSGNVSGEGGGNTETQRFASSSASIASLLGPGSSTDVTDILVNGRKIEVDLANDSLASLRDKILVAGGAASIVTEKHGSRDMYRLSATGSVSADSSVADPAVSRRIVELLGFTLDGRANQVVAGSDAKIKIDGFAVTRRTNTITDAIDGVTLNVTPTGVTARQSSTSTSDLSILQESLSIDPGTYRISLITSKAVTNAANLSVVSDPGISNGTYEVKLNVRDTTTRTTTTSNSRVQVLSSPSSVPAGTYTLETTSTTNRTSSGSNANLTVGNWPTTVAAGTYGISLTTSRATSASAGTLAVSSAPSTVGAGTYGVEVISSRSGTASSSALSVTNSPSTVAAGTYSIAATIARTTTTSSGSLVVSNSPSSVAAGSYGVNLTTSRSSSASSGNLAVTSAPSTVGAGTYGVEVLTSRSSSASTGTLSVTNAPSTVAAGTYAVSATTTRSTSTSSGSLSVTSAPSNVAAGNYNVSLTTSRTTSTSSANLTVNDAPSTAAAGTYAVNVTALATVASRVGSGFDGSYKKSGGAVDQITISSGGKSATVTLNNQETLSTVITNLNNAFTSNGMTMRAVDSGGQLKLESTAPAGSSSTFTTSVSNTNVTTNLGIGNSTFTGTDIQATIGGLAATGSGNVITGATGTAVAGLKVTYTGASTGAIGNVTVTDSISGGTVGGQAATWDAATQTLTGNSGTSVSGLAVKYTGAVVSGSVGNVTVTDAISGGTIGGQAATWDAATQTFTGASGTSVAGLSVRYTGGVTSGALGNVTVTDTITGGKIGGQTAAWDAATQTFTGNSGTSVAGLAVRYTGPATAGAAGNVTVTDTISGGTIGGQAATWDAATQTLTGNSGTGVADLAVRYTGAAAAGNVGTVTVADSITGGTIGGQAATWDAATQTFTGASGTSVDGLSVRYTGAATSGTLGSVTIADTITGGKIGGQSATWDAATQTFTGASGTTVAGLAVTYTGSATSGAVGSVTLVDTINGGTIGGQAATWDAATQTLTGNSGTSVADLAVKYAGAAAAGNVGEVTLNSDGVITGGKFIAADGTQHTATWDSATKTFLGAPGSSMDGLEVKFTGTPTTGTVGTFTLTDTTTTEISGGTIGGFSATWNATERTLTADASTPLGSLKVRYAGTAAAAATGIDGTPGRVGDVIVNDTNPVTIVGATINGTEATWNNTTRTISGGSSTLFAGLQLSFTGAPKSGHVGDLIVTGEGAVDLTISRDTDPTVQKVKDFAAAFNEVRSFVDKQRTTDGPLGNSAQLRSALSSFKDALLNEVEGTSGFAFTRTAQIGMTLSKTGQLEVDATKLTEILANRTTDFATLISALGTKVTDRADRLVRPTTGSIATQVESARIAKDAIGRRVADAERRMDIRREALTLQFSQMENAMSRFQTQGSWLGQQIAMMQATNR